ncbi:O-antigen ligase family protein [Alteromonas ponticola]|uniref:O-antigen ligase family protein n=1 Tax=Alteromonas ponticola TaxID=2720613 RepID=A0ABX1R214_9ALTE|nr:O-antigen ligase family protein [Alteromonas ponticola]NMH60509.1 O-antigen ligase family protein [Alteromonas ponticola]
MFTLVKIVFALLSAFLVYRAISRQCNKYLAFVVVALWLRFTLSAFHNVTYDPLFAGFSINALASIGIAFAGLLLLPRKVIALRSLLWLYIFLACIVVSGIVNMRTMGLINVMVKWTVFLVIAGALFMAIRKTGKDLALRKVLVAFFLPVSLQIMSVLLGEVKATEADGSASYIGGYNHEAAFSMIIASFTLVVGLLSSKAIRYRAALFALGCVLVVLANYRTSILAILPMTAMFAFSLIEAKVANKHKPVFYVLSLFGIGLAFLALSYTMQDRFGDIFVFLSSWQDLIKAPEYYSEAEKDIFSARVYIWSLYIHAYLLADPINQIFGMGPEAWNGVFKKYAHNTYVSYLYEYGVVGLLAFLTAVGSFLIQAFKTKDRKFAWLLFSSMIGFLIMNLATMPLWNIEGLLLYALLIGVTISPVNGVRKTALKTSGVSTNLARN